MKRIRFAEIYMNQSTFIFLHSLYVKLLLYYKSTHQFRKRQRNKTAY